MRQILYTILSILTTTLCSQNAYLGVVSNPINQNKAQILQLDPYGAYLSGIMPGSAAEKGGLKVFDYVTKIGDLELTEQNSLHDIIKNYKPNDKVDVYFTRNSEKRKLSITLEATPGVGHIARKKTEDPFLGIHETHNYDLNEISGIRVNVGKGSTADLIGIKNGDIITFIDQYRMVDWHDLRTAIDNRNVGDAIEVTVWRNGSYTTQYGPIKSENGHTDLDKQIDMKFMEVQIMPMPKENQNIPNILSPEEKQLNFVSDFKIKIFPNPNIGRFTVEALLDPKKQSGIFIYDSQGRLILEENINEPQTIYNRNFDLGNNPAGIYFMKVIQGNEIMTRKIIVTKP